MSIKKDGGQAFPRSGYGPVGNGQLEGMALRDYFAAKAMQGMLANDIGCTGQAEHLSSCAYQMADSMIVERAK